MMVQLEAGVRSRPRELVVDRQGMRQTVKRGVRGVIRVLRRAVPLSIRRTLVAGVGRQTWVPYIDWMSTELLRDFADGDPVAWHRFAWTHHLAYARDYRVDRRFGSERIHQSRRLLFDDLREYLVRQGVLPERDIRSVFEVGSSLGYLLRHVETGLFASAATLEGIDIDRKAIALGASYLTRIGSKVQLTVADMTELDRILSGRTVDVVLCAGVLMYLSEKDAHEVVRSILRHTGVVAAIAGLAHPSVDNANLTSSDVRDSDATFIHNIDDMVLESGGEVVWRRWEGPRIVDGNTIYFVFARRTPSRVTASYLG